MRHQVQVQRRATGSGTRGQGSDTWEDVGPQIFANVKTLRGAEFDQANKKWEQAEKQVELYYGSPGLDKAENRLIFEGRIFEIGWIDDTDEIHTKLTLLVREYKNG
jgi:SPP1 family predicted phage head-tail adaptor